MPDIFDRYFRPGYDKPHKFVVEALSNREGYFAFGSNTVCFGRTNKGFVANRSEVSLYDTSADVKLSNGEVELPFDPSEIVTNLCCERYMRSGLTGSKKLLRTLVRNTYYAARPLLPLGFRSHLQEFYLRGWEKLTFPSWPVDTTVERLMKGLLALHMKSAGMQTMPFIWFWPDGADSCAIMTHDVEEEEGRTFCSKVMDMNDEFGIPASFQVVPEKRYEVRRDYIDEVKSRGFEINVQDLDHDGRLYWDLDEFKRRVEKINHYGREWNADGFRAAILYRNQEWFGMFDFAYDMSIPNVAHLDPQRGGCCTVMPFFVGDMLELPVTTTQDHTLFHILKDYSLGLWNKQIAEIRKSNGLISFIIHPDYIIEDRAQRTYRDLLAELSRLRQEDNVWIALPGDANRWWRNRSAMTLQKQGGTWVIDGPEKERARVAFAQLEGDSVVFEVPSRLPCEIRPQR